MSINNQLMIKEGSSMTDRHIDMRHTFLQLSEQNKDTMILVAKSIKTTQKVIENQQRVTKLGNENKMR